MATVGRQLHPAALKWRHDGELDSQDLFALVCRLRQVEAEQHSNELWRLGHKYPQGPRTHRVDGTVSPEASAS